MKPLGNPLPFTLAIIVVAGLFMPSRAPAQDSDADLRRHNQQLAAEILELQKQLREVQERNRALQDQVAQLERDLAAAKSAVPAPPPVATRPPVKATPPKEEEPEVVTVDETVANASPRALFKAVIANHDEAMAGMDVGQPGDTVRRSYLRKLQNWRSSVNRQFRSPVTWRVRAIDARVGPDNQRIVTLVAVDPQTDVRLGNPFDVALSQTLFDRLAKYESRGELNQLVMRGTLIPEVRINDSRDVKGTFDNPPFIGPFVEFMYRVEVSSLTLPREDPKEDPKGNPKEPATTEPPSP